jgi:hypothetical protein
MPAKEIKLKRQGNDCPAFLIDAMPIKRRLKTPHQQ